MHKAFLDHHLALKNILVCQSSILNMNDDMRIVTMTVRVGNDRYID